MEFKRGDKITYKGGEMIIGFKEDQAIKRNLLPLITTYIWATIQFDETLYVIEHEQGVEKGFFSANEMNPDGLNETDLKQLKDRVKYVVATKNDIEIYVEPEPEPEPSQEENISDESLIVIKLKSGAQYRIDEELYSLFQSQLMAMNNEIISLNKQISELKKNPKEN